MPLTDLDLPPSGQIGDLLLARFRATPLQPAMARRDGAGWRIDRWCDVEGRLSRLEQHITGLGVARGTRVAIWMPTGAAWTLCDWACLRLGAVSVAFHAGWTRRELSHALRVAPPAVIVCASSCEETVVAELRESGREAALLLLDEAHQARPEDTWLWADVKQITPKDQGIAATQPDADAAATIVFTSGSQGEAKGIVLSQRAMLTAAWEAYHQLGFDGRGRRTLHWLPLSHMFARLGPVIDVIAGATGHYGRGADFLAEDLTTARPHLLFAVPKVLARLHERIEQRRLARRPLARALFAGLLGLGAAVARLPTPWRVALQPGLRRFVFPAVHRPLGGSLGCVVVGGAPVDVLHKCYFERLGWAVRDGFGMTETAGVASVQPLRRRSGGAGPLLPSLRARLGRGGELALAGATLLRCALPEPERDPQSWFETGDLAVRGKDGSLTITGRSKDLVITDSGENVAPASIEARLTRHVWIEDACVVGDARPCLIALLALSNGGRDAAAVHGIAAVEAALRQHRDTINRDLPRHERVHGQVVLVQGFDAAAGELTVTQKKRRARIVERHAAAIDQCYSMLKLAPEKHRGAAALHPARGGVTQ